MKRLNKWNINRENLKGMIKDLFETAWGSFVYLIVVFIGSIITGIIIFYHNSEVNTDYNIGNLLEDKNYIAGVNFVILGVFISLLFFYNEFHKKRKKYLMFL